MPQKRESCAAGPAYPALRWRNAASKAVGDAMQKFAFLTLQVTSGARVVAVQGIFHFPMKLTRIGRTPCCQDPFRMFRYAHLTPSAVHIANPLRFFAELGGAGKILTYPYPR